MPSIPSIPSMPRLTLRRLWETPYLIPVWYCSLAALTTLRVDALRHTFTAHREKGLIGPIGEPFGYLERGHFNLKVSNFDLALSKDGEEDLDDPTKVLGHAEAGFILRRFHNEASFIQHMDLWRTNETLCAFEPLHDAFQVDDDQTPRDDQYQSHNDDDDAAGLLTGPTNADNGILLNPNAALSVEYKFQSGEEGLYFLIYHVCPYNPYFESSFELEFHFGNSDSSGRERYLSSGLMALPMLYLYFSVSYFLCGWIWYSNIRLIQQGQWGYFVQHDNHARPASARDRPVVYPIHQLMTLLVILKFWSVLFESLRFHKINVSGHAEVWSFFYYTISFVNGVFLFSVILLIGTGWSMIKPFLNLREKQAILAVLVLQVFNNLAILVLSNETAGESAYSKWTFVLHAVDIVCCCAVLVPIVWQVNQLEKSAGLDDVAAGDMIEANQDTALDEDESQVQADVLSKLKLFRTFYLLVIGYVYSTRILIYLFVSLLDYRHLWIQHLVIEVITLAFYVAVGMLFRPIPELSSYQSVAVSDETAVAAAKEVELSLTTQTRRD